MKSFPLLSLPFSLLAVSAVMAPTQSAVAERVVADDRFHAGILSALDAFTKE